MQVNKLNIYYYMRQYVGGYSDRTECMPDLTREGWDADVQNLMSHAHWFGETYDLRIMLGYLLSLPNHEMVKYGDDYVFDHYDDEAAEEFRKVVGYALDVDWPEDSKTYEEVKDELEWVEVEFIKWAEQRPSPRNEYIASKNKT